MGHSMRHSMGSAASQARSLAPAGCALAPQHTHKVSHTRKGKGLRCWVRSSALRGAAGWRTAHGMPRRARTTHVPRQASTPEQKTKTKNVHLCAFVPEGVLPEQDALELGVFSDDGGDGARALYPDVVLSQVQDGDARAPLQDLGEGDDDLVRQLVAGQVERGARGKVKLFEVVLAFVGRVDVLLHVFVEVGQVADARGRHARDRQHDQRSERHTCGGGSRRHGCVLGSRVLTCTYMSTGATALSICIGEGTPVHQRGGSCAAWMLPFRRSVEGLVCAVRGRACGSGSAAAASCLELERVWCAGQ